MGREKGNGAKRVSNSNQSLCRDEKHRANARRQRPAAPPGGAARGVSASGQRGRADGGVSVERSASGKATAPTALRCTNPPHPHSHTLTTTRTFTPADVANFLALSDDANPVHTDSAAAAAAGLCGAAALPGLLTASLFPGLVGTAAPGAVYARQTLAFLAPVPVGAAVTASVEVTRLARSRAPHAARAYFRTRAWTTGGVLAVEGTATALLPKGRYLGVVCF